MPKNVAICVRGTRENGSVNDLAAFTYVGKNGPIGG